MQKLTPFLFSIAFTFVYIIHPEAFAMDNKQLDAKQQAIVPIASFTASGDIEKLKRALHDGLDAGLTVNEVKEVLVQLYAYAGFPRSLNALGAFAETLDARRQKGINDQAGKEAGPFPPEGKTSLEAGAETQTPLSAFQCRAA